MAFLDWDQSFELGIKPFDEHHRHLVHLLNEVHNNYLQHSDQQALGAIIDRLIEYATHHFAAEEQWMAAQGYDGLLEHSREHYEFSLAVARFQKDFHAGKQTLSNDILSFLKDWLFSHIFNSDADYARFAREGKAPSRTEGT